MEEISPLRLWLVLVKIFIVVEEWSVEEFVNIDILPFLYYDRSIVSTRTL